MSEQVRPSITALWEHFGGRVLMTGGTNHRGRFNMAHCCLPGHEDVRASARIWEDEGYWECWAESDAFGDEYDLIMRMYGTGFVEAQRWAADFLAAGGAEVRRPDRPGDSVVPGRQGHRQGRRASWLARFSRGTGAGS